MLIYFDTTLDARMNWYSRNQTDSMHWGEKKQLKEIFWRQLDCMDFEREVFTGAFEVEFKHNLRFDVDNIFGSGKWLIDWCKHQGIIVDDNRKYMKKVSSEYDNTLDSGVITIKFRGYKTGLEEFTLKLSDLGIEGLD